MTLDLAHWQERLDLLAEKHGVVGASLAISLNGESISAATGLLSLTTRVPVTTDSVFLVGSITKTWTATLLMQLVDEGLLDLDKPVIDYLPDFRVADPTVTATVTPRQLLTHVSGIQGDFVHDTGRGDDALSAYVAAMSELGQSHPQGAIFSYTNAGFILLGHLVATLRGATWETVVRERLFRPLELSRAGTLPEEALLQSVSVGHLYDAETGTHVSDTWGPLRSMGPTGNIHATPSEVLTFAAMHVAGGVTASGTRILSEASAAAMRVPQVEAKGSTTNTNLGLAWFLEEWDGAAVFGHSGAITGHIAFLNILPAKGLSFCLLTNGGRAPSDLGNDLSEEIALELAGVNKPRPAAPPVPPLSIDASRFIGRYVCEGFDSTIVETEPGVLVNQVTITGELAGLLPDMTLELVRFSDDVLLGRVIGGEEWMPAVFFEIDGERYMQAAERAFRKIG